MPTFSFWYDESSTYKAWFEAESLEQAEELLRQVQDGENMFEDLPSVLEKHKGGSLEIAISTLEQEDN